MITYNKDKKTICYKENIYNSCDEVDMSILIDELNKALALKNHVESRTSVTISDIFDEAIDISDIYNILNLPIFCVSLTGDEFGFDLFTVGKDGIYLMQNSYYKVGI